MGINFNYTGANYRVKSVSLHKEWLLEVIRFHQCIAGDIQFVFCDDDKIIEINRSFLNHDYYTDIITFDYSEGKTIAGELYISIDTVRSNAQQFDAPLATELRRVMVHGILHLLGYNDKSEADKRSMKQAEDKWLQIFDLDFKP